MQDEAKAEEIISHGEFIEKMQALGHLSDEGGICYGFAAASALAWLSGKKKGLDYFNQCLALIHAIPLEAFKQDLAWDKVQPFLEKQGDTRFVFSGREITAETWGETRSEILAVFDQVESLFQAESHPELFGGCDLHFVSAWPPAVPPTIPFTYPCYVYVKKKEGLPGEKEGGQLFCMSAEGQSSEMQDYSDMLRGVIARLDEQGTTYKRLSAQVATRLGLPLQETIPTEQSLHAASLVRSKTMEERGENLVIADHFWSAYTLADLETYFQSMAVATQSMVLMLNSVEHAITVIYDHDERKWLLSDANKIKIAGHYIDTPQKIAAEVFSSLSKNTLAVFKTSVITSLKAPLHPDIVTWKTHVHLSQEAAAVLVDTGNTDFLLRLAAKEGDKATVETLLEAGASCQYWVIPPHLYTAEMVALLRTHATAQKMLFTAAEQGGIQTILDILKVNPNRVVKQIDRQSETLLFIAARNGHVEIVEALLKGGANVNQVNKKGENPLQVVDALLKRKTPSNRIRMANQIPQEHSQEIARLLRTFSLVDTLKAYIRKEKEEAASTSINPSPSVAFLPAPAPLHISSEKCRAAEALLHALTEEGVHLSTLEPYMKTLEADDALSKIYLSACDVFPTEKAAAVEKELPLSHS